MWSPAERTAKNSVSGLNIVNGIQSYRARDDKPRHVQILAHSLFTGKPLVPECVKAHNAGSRHPGDVYAWVPWTATTRLRSAAGGVEPIGAVCLMPSGVRSVRLAVHTCTTSSGPTGDPRHAHRGQRATDDRLDRGDESAHARRQVWSDNFETTGTDHSAQQESSNPFDHGQCPPFAFLSAKMAGRSSKSRRSPGLTFLAPAGTVAVNRSAATSPPVFHALMSMVYCGVPAT